MPPALSGFVVAPVLEVLDPVWSGFRELSVAPRRDNGAEDPPTTTELEAPSWANATTASWRLSNPAAITTTCFAFTLISVFSRPPLNAGRSFSSGDQAVHRKVAGEPKDHKTWKVLSTVVYVEDAPRSCDETTTWAVRLGFSRSGATRDCRPPLQFWCTHAGVRKWIVAGRIHHQSGVISPTSGPRSFGA